MGYLFIILTFMYPRNSTTLYMLNNNDKTNQNVPENYQHRIEIVVGAIIFTYIYSG